MRKNIEEDGVGKKESIGKKGKPFSKRASILLLIVAMLLGLSGCQSPFNSYPNPKTYLSEDRDQKWINDITYLETVLPKKHKNLYFKQTEDYFIQSLEDLKGKVSQYTDEELNFKLSIIVASMGDTHTRLNIGLDKQYPLNLYWYDEGIYIVDTGEDYKDLLYSKIISLNEKPIEEVAEAFKPFFAGANEQWFKNQVMYYIPSPALLKYFGIIEEDKISLKLETLEGKVKEVEMLPITSEEVQFIQDESVYNIPFYKQHPYENYWQEYLPEDKLLYVSFRSSMEMLDKPFAIFTEEVFKTLKEEKVEKLVIDLRENQGGNPIFTPFLKKLKKSPLNNKNQLFVVMGRKTYSQGLNTVLLLKRDTEATVIGEKSGGQPNHYGQTKMFRLPNSQIGVSYSTRYIKTIKEDKDYLEPDIPIGVSFEKEKEGKDAAMEWIKGR